MQKKQNSFLTRQIQRSIQPKLRGKMLFIVLKVSASEKGLQQAGRSSCNA
jgi:hypothetical protein